jgi:hypothetical protein
MRKQLLIAFSLLAFGISVLFLLQDRGQWVETDGHRFWVRLTEYDPPLQIGMEAPPVPWRHRRLLADVHKGMNWTKLSLSDAKLLAAKEDVDQIEQKMEEWSTKLAGNPDIVHWNQRTVEYAIEVEYEASPERYLLVCGQDGLHNQRSDWPHGVPCSVYIWDKPHWRNCGTDPTREFILQHIPHTKVAELRSFLMKHQIHGSNRPRVNPPLSP